MHQVEVSMPSSSTKIKLWYLGIDYISGTAVTRGYEVHDLKLVFLARDEAEAKVRAFNELQMLAKKLRSQHEPARNWSVHLAPVTFVSIGEQVEAKTADLNPAIIAELTLFELFPNSGS